jgi:methyl-accepting chemotaxis protein
LVQWQGINQVNKVVAHIDQVTRTGAAETTELAATSEVLAEQARQLQALVGRFRLREDADAAAVSEPAAARPALLDAEAAPVRRAARGRAGYRAALAPAAAGRDADDFVEF